MRTVTIFIVAILLSSVNVSFAQFGKLKIKKPKVNVGAKNKTTKSTTSTAESSSSTNKSSTSTNNTGRTSEGAPTRRSELPSYEPYCKVRDNIKYARSAMEEASWKMSPDTDNQKKILKYLSKAKENLEILNQDPEEKNRAYVKEFQEACPALEKQCMDDMANFAVKAKYSEKLETYNRWVSLGRDFNDDTFKPSYKDYYDFVKKYEMEDPAGFKRDRTQSILSTVNNFFEVEVYSKVGALDKEVTGLIKNVHRLNNRQEKSYLLNADIYLKKFEKPMNLLNEYKNNLLKDHTSANALETKINKEKSMLEEYISSGKLAAHQAKYAQEIIDNRLLKKGMSDSEIETFAKDELPSEHGKVLRVAISSKNWYVNKNAYIPLNKNVNINYATKKEDGKCYYIGAVLRRDYEGGGQYGNWYLTEAGRVGEMNCDNIAKNAKE